MVMAKFEDDDVHVLTKAEERILMEQNKRDLDEYKARGKAGKKRRVAEIDAEIAELEALRKQALKSEEVIKI